MCSACVVIIKKYNMYTVNYEYVIHSLYTRNPLTVNSVDQHKMLLYITFQLFISVFTKIKTIFRDRIMP